MKITERLKVEHGIFLRQLHHVEVLLKRHAEPAELAAAVDVIAAADEYHAAIEDIVVYPALAEVLGADADPLRKMAADHARVKDLVETIRSGAFDEATVSTYVNTFRDHMEREIHRIFPLVDEAVPEERLAEASRWDVEHVFDEAGESALWLEKLSVERPEPAAR